MCMDVINKNLEGKTNNYKGEFRIQCKNGEYKWIFGQGRVVERDNKGKALRVIGTITDIDVRKKLEKELSYTKILMQAAFDQSPVPMAVITYPDYTFKIINKAAEDFFVDKNRGLLK